MRMRSRWCAVGWVIVAVGCGAEPEPRIDAATDAATHDARIERLDADVVDGAAADAGAIDAAGDPACDDGAQNGVETDVDCGGGTCPACDNGDACAVAGDCLSERCESSVCTSPEGTHPDIVRVIDVVGREPGGGWSDSYSVGDQCYCESTFDHDIGAVVVTTPAGPRTVRGVCEALGAGPGSVGRPIYNDIQCGNGPANDAGDEDDCPGRVDLGREGCGHIGPTWDLSVVFAE